MKIYHVETQESYDELMIELEEKGENITQEEIKQKEIKQNIFDWARGVSVAVESFTRDMPEAEADLQEARSSAKKAD